MLALWAARAALASDFAIDCDVAGRDVRSLVVAAPASVPLSARVLSPGVIAVDVGAADVPGLREGEVACPAARSVRVLSGRTLGAAYSRVLVSFSGDAPRIVSTPGKLRLLWLPAAPAPPAPVAALPRPPAERPAPRPAAAPQAPPASPPAEEQPARASLSPPPAAEAPSAPRVVTPPPAPPPAAAGTSAPLPVYTPAEIPPGTPGPPPSPIGQPGELPKDFLRLPESAKMVVLVPTDARAGAGERYRAMRRLAKDEAVVADGRAGDWLRLDDGSWAFAAFLGPAEEGAAAGLGTATVTAVTTPVHAGPGGQFEVVTELYQGQDVVLDDVNGEWAHVRNGGWVRRSALRSTGTTRGAGP